MAKKKKQSSSAPAPASSSSSLSLASQLRRDRGTSDSTPLPPVFPSDKPFLTLAKDKQLFHDCWQTSYTNFCWESPEDIDTAIHDSYQHCFAALEGLYLYDAVQPGGQRVSSTFVKRTLIGNPGSTYKYLGLRLFSHPWSWNDSDSDSSNIDSTATASTKLQQMMAYGYSQQHAKALLQMGDLNQIVIQKTKQQLKQLKSNQSNNNNNNPSKLLGSCHYSLTLVNRMDPSVDKKDLKRDATIPQKTSVSWHKDSGLQDFSSIAVYHQLVSSGANQELSHTKPWSVALRVSAPPPTTGNSSGSSSGSGSGSSATKKKDKNSTTSNKSTSTTTPALVIPLPSGALYYLLDDFNHQHDHAVLAGARQLRYSSTHRVARGSGHSPWHTLQASCQRLVLQQNNDVTVSKPPSQSQNVKQLRAQQQLWTELEFEWIRQWYLQGQDHADLHAYWHTPIAYMEQCWTTIHESTMTLLATLEKESQVTNNKTASSSNNNNNEDLYDVLIEAYQERLVWKDKWDRRLADPLYLTLAPTARPMPCALFVDQGETSTKTTKSSIATILSNLRHWKKRQFAGDSKTKKEKRKVASNWEAMMKSSATTNTTSSSSKTTTSKKQKKR
eukprot:CAMPEP_0119010458 /NCGR_PEP_ID=MMETSP1176-20130426/5023_1 /TAXON_ID=265551 /ORGANISM="Synedropsis recta cf, Strain CCMP1620" /LENGTH=611 /DNA_ID=CAMNT_0006963119 /DNA_START=69 /DNA_END=1900 /DNA_ORIENTATION=-